MDSDLAEAISQEIIRAAIAPAGTQPSEDDAGFMLAMLLQAVLREAMHRQDRAEIRARHIEAKRAMRDMIDTVKAELQEFGRARGFEVEVGEGEPWERERRRRLQ